MHAGEALADPQPQLGVAHQVVEGEAGSRQTESRPPTPSPAHSSPVGWAVLRDARVLERGLEEVLRACRSRPGTRSKPAITASSGQRAPSPPSSATRARRCGARRPGSRRRCPPPRRWPGWRARRGPGARPRARCASGTARPEEHPEHHPERVEGGEQRRQVAEHAEHHVAAAAVERERQDLVLGEEARHAAGSPPAPSAPIVKVTKVNGIALRKPPIRSSDWTPPMAAITEPAPMNRSALKKACVIRWNSPGRRTPRPRRPGSCSRSATSSSRRSPA